jgi:tungstate transport system ATP-binding protein
MKQPLLEAKNIYLKYRTGFELNVPILKLFPGEVLGIIGPNGCGKSTLIKTLSLLLKPDRGKVALDGKGPIAASEAFKARRNFSVVFQAPLLFDRSVKDNVALPLKFRKEPPRVIEEKVRKWLDTFGIKHLAQRRVNGLSGGEARRVCLARALVTNPRVLFMDEPFTNIDQPAKETLIHDLGAALRDLDIAVMIVTHDREEAALFSDRMGVMRDGKIVQTGPPTQIFNQPATPFVADFVGVENIFKGESQPGLEQGNIKINGVRMTAPTDITGPVHLIIRPEDILLSAAKISSSARNQFQGKITKVVPRERTYYITVDVGVPLTCLVTRISKEELQLEPGRQIWLQFKASSVHVI